MPDDAARTMQGTTLTPAFMEGPPTQTQYRTAFKGCWVKNTILNLIFLSINFFLSHYIGKIENLECFVF